ncbi:MAG TPA: hypothetical protein PLU30_17280 [Verrucomicrobiae bacterium]|nr:hypothetical protein [Verrucomicrobiae bacterium]
METVVAIQDVEGKVSASPLGLQIRGELSFAEWKRLAPKIGQALRSCAFVVGDWLVYGEERFGDQPLLPGIDPGPSRTVSREQYDAAHAATGIDEAVLANYAYVARNVPRSMRRESLSWEHHRAVAKLEEPEQGRWLEQAEKAELTSRRLRASISAGRVVEIEELGAPADPGIPNHIPAINRLSAWWGQITATDWLQRRTLDQLEAMLRDFAPVETILGQIRQAAEQQKKGRL